MSAVDKNQAVIAFIKTCPHIQDNPIFCNFGNVIDGASQVSIQSDDVALHRPYIDGSVLKRYTFILDIFKSINDNPVTAGTDVDENIEDFGVAQSILDWINDQDDLGNYPSFGTDCTIDKMETTTNKPELFNVDTTLNPPVAVYRISIQIEYIDKSKTIWK